MSRDIQAVVNPVWELLDGIANLQAFDAEFVNADGDPVEPDKDDDGRVHAHAVFYPSAGLLRSLTLDATPDVLDAGFQVTCVGGDRVRALWCVNQVRQALTGTWISVAGQDLQIQETPGDTGPIRRDDDPKPPRFYLPLTFAVIGA